MKKILGIVVLCAVAVSAIAVPARREGILRTAADGTEKMVYLHGDAFYHFITDSEGRWLDDTTLEPLTEEAQAARAEQLSAHAKARRAPQQRRIGGQINLAPRGLIVLVNFKDLAFTTPIDTIKNMIDGENFTRNYTNTYTYQGRQVTEHITCRGSAKQYFHDQSWGQYNPVFDVVGPVTLSQNMAYYGKNDSRGNDMHVDDMVREACLLADQEGADYNLYDNNDDGEVDFVYFIYAGEGEADGGAATTIWPHNYDYQYYGSTSFTVDGKTVGNYACSNEINHYGGNYAGIGTFCHEFSHVLGLPDLYETNNPSTGLHTLCDWDILDYGPYLNDGNTPPAYSAYERFFMGWLTPRVLSNPELVTLPELNTADENRKAVLLCAGDQHNLNGADPSPTTFYLLEHREKTGWDKYLPGKGLLITKIKYNYENWAYNRVNNSSYNMGVDLIEARENTSQVGATTDAYPAGATRWTGFTGHEVTEIMLKNGLISFSYRGGTEALDAVMTTEATAKMLHDGRVVIIRGGKAYDLSGRLINIEQ